MNEHPADVDRRQEFLKFVVFDLMVAVVFGLISWIVERDPITSLLISFLTAAVLLVVELRFQIRGTTKELAAALGVGVESLDDEPLMTTLVGAATDHNRVAAYQNQHFIARADEIVRAFSHEINTLGEGYMVLNPNEAFPYYVKLLDDTHKTGFFTLLLRVARFWYRTNNQDYVEANLRTAARGVKMTRVVIVEKIEDLSPELVDLVRALVEGGIDVRIAFEHDLAAEVIVDMGLYDDKFVAYSDINPGDRGLKGTRILWRPSDLRKAVTIRDRILHESEDAMQFLARSHLLPADHQAAATPQELVRLRTPTNATRRN